MFFKPSFFIFTCILILCNHSHAQTGFLLGASGSYLYSYRKLTINDNYYSLAKRTRDNAESPLSSFLFSIDGLYQFKNNWNLSSAVSISNAGYQIKDGNKNFGAIITSKGFSDQIPNLEKAGVNYRLLNLSIPLMIGYRLPFGEHKNHSFLVRAGLQNHITLKSEAIIVLTYDDGSKEKERDQIKIKDNAYTLSACANIGYYYQIQKSTIGVNLLGDYGLMPQNKNITNIKQYGYYGGVGLSYFYSFSK